MSATASPQQQPNKPTPRATPRTTPTLQQSTYSAAEMMEAHTDVRFSVDLEEEEEEYADALEIKQEDTYGVQSSPSIPQLNLSKINESSKPRLSNTPDEQQNPPASHRDLEFLHKHRDYLYRNNRWYKVYLKYLQIRNFTWNVFQQKEITPMGTAINSFLVFIVFASVFFLCISTEELILVFLENIFKSRLAVAAFFFIVEYAAVVIFSVELMLRFFSCTAGMLKNKLTTNI